MANLPTAAKTSGPRRRGRQPALTREQIADAALNLIDRDGLASLTMRRLAAELGIGAMSLYRYFRDKEELLDAVVDASSRQAEASLELHGTWREQITTLMRALYRNLTRHPSLVQIRLARPMLSATALRLTEASMRVLTAAGLSREAAARGYRTMFLYTFACAAFDAGQEPGQLVRLARSALSAVPPDRYPAIATSTDQLAVTMDSGRQFELGLQTIIAGLENDDHHPPRGEDAA